MSNLKHKILAVSRKIEEVKVPELGLTVFIRRMNGVERVAFQAEQDKVKDGGLAAVLALQPILLSLTLCDEDGEQIFSDAKDLSLLDALVIDRLAVIALNINGLTTASREAIEKKLMEPNGSGIS